MMSISKNSNLTHFLYDRNSMNYLHIGETFTIILDGNPTTGYSWQYQIVGDPSIVSIQDNYTPYSNRIGSGGQFIYNGKAMKRGQISIIFSYARPWETNIPPINIKQYNITVI